MPYIATCTYMYKWRLTATPIHHRPISILTNWDLPWNLPMWSWNPHSLNFCLTNSSAIFKCCKGNEIVLREHTKQIFHHAGSGLVTWCLCVCVRARRETQPTNLAGADSHSLAGFPSWLSVAGPHSYRCGCCFFCDNPQLTVTYTFRRACSLQSIMHISGESFFEEYFSPFVLGLAIVVRQTGLVV